MFIIPVFILSRQCYKNQKQILGNKWFASVDGCVFGHPNCYLIIIEYNFNQIHFTLREKEKILIQILWKIFLKFLLSMSKLIFPLNFDNDKNRGKKIIQKYLVESIAFAITALFQRTATQSKELRCRFILFQFLLM